MSFNFTNVDVQGYELRTPQNKDFVVVLTLVDNITGNLFQVEMLSQHSWGTNIRSLMKHLILESMH